MPEQISALFDLSFKILWITWILASKSNIQFVKGPKDLAQTECPWTYMANMVDNVELFGG